MSRSTLALLLATLAGLGLAVGAVGWVGFAPVLGVVARIGVPGFAALVGYSALPLALLGGAWWACAPPPESGSPRPGLLRFTWARTVREGATDVLPFAQFGGLLVGARVLTAAGVAAATVWAAMVADLSTELAAQLVFTLYGVGALALRLAHAGAAPDLWPPVAAGVAVSIAILAAFLALQRPMLRLAGGLAERVLPGAAKATAGVADGLAAIYARRPAIAAALALNLAAWIASAAGAWLALRFMHAGIGLANVLTIEALIFTLRSAAFMIPGALGLQEAAYALIGPLFGLDPATALALSLIKRARDLAIGVPALLLWQAGEGRRLLRATPAAPTSEAR